ncbi:MAG: SpoIIIAH-like family protein [Eubacteriales bacterium]|nr:SpoIIIAH-like family protein [Clostridiales bacterium]MDD7773181.1 SpoIIIAH-like family protein [Eubacteriales bacterium]MDY3941482.1 SpoIIIAH-like family protein [Eubacteriales bacterium]
MQWNEVREKTKKVIGKLGKKSIITICTVLVLGCAVVLNVILYQNGQTEKQSNKLAIDLSEAGETTDTQTEGTIGAYFQSMSLNRKQARDEAMEVLQAVADSQTALDEAKEAAWSDMTKLAADMEKETNIEAMILSKGFSQCIAVISNDTCNVIVESEGLNPGEVAQISEIVYEQAGIVPSNLKIVEKSSADM